jgi:DNA-binding LacI/PurR family transcriptional regulator
MISAFRKFYSGLIIVGEAADEYTIRTLRSTDYPFVLLEKNVSRLRLNTVSTDSIAGAALVANHIGKLGYRNVLLISDPKTRQTDEPLIAELVSSLSSVEGVSKPESVEIRTPAPGDDFDFTLLEKYLRPPFSVQMLVVAHANMVYPIMSALQKRKIRVPQDIAIISMEEGIGFELLHCPVTSLKKPFSGLALKTANMIWTEVKNAGKGKFKRQVNLAPELVIRHSCGSL